MNKDHGFFYLDKDLIALYKQLVNAAKDNNFTQIPESVRTIFITELEAIRTYIDKLIKQPTYIGGMRRRLKNEEPTDIESRILAREFERVADTEPINDTLEGLIKKYTLRNLDYYKFLFMLGDNYAALRTIVRMRKDITDVYVQPINYIDEYHKSFGFDIYKYFSSGTRRQILAEEMSTIRKKGTTSVFGKLLTAMGYNEFAIVGYWLDQDPSDLLFKLFPRVMYTEGNPSIDYLDPLIEPINNLDDPLWMLTNNDLLALQAANENWFPSRAPYIGLILSLNLEDATTTSSLLFGSIFFATTVFRNEMNSVRNIGTNSYGKEISISELYLAISWLSKNVFGVNPFLSDDHKTLYVWNGDYTDDNGNVLDDDTITNLILQDWKSIFKEPINTRLEKEKRQLLFREKFLKMNTTDSGKVYINENFPLEYVAFTDATTNYRIIPDEYIYNSGEINVLTNPSYAGHTFYVTALDFEIEEKYETGDFYVSLNLPYTKQVEHNLNNKYNIVVQFRRNYDYGAWQITLPEEIHFIDDNNLEVVSNGVENLNKIFNIKVYKPDAIAEITPTYTNLDFLIEHDLDFKYPIVEVVDTTTDEYIIPDTIEFKTNNSFSISFSNIVANHNLKILLKKGNLYTLEPIQYDGYYNYLIVNGIDKTVEDELKERNEEFYDFIQSRIAMGSNYEYNLLKELVEALEVYLYDVSNIYFPFRKFLFGFDDDVKQVLNWSKPYHVKLLKVITSVLIKDPVNDAMLVGDHFMAIKPRIKLWDYFGCRYDIGGIYSQSSWKYDLCGKPSDYYKIHINMKLMGGFMGLRYDTDHLFDTGYFYDMSPAIGDAVFAVRINRILQQHIDIIDQFKTRIENKQTQNYALQNEYVFTNPKVFEFELVNKYETKKFLVTNKINTNINLISEDKGFIIFNTVNDETYSLSDGNFTELVALQFSESISVDDSGLTITVS